MGTHDATSATPESDAYTPKTDDAPDTTPPA